MFVLKHWEAMNMILIVTNKFYQHVNRTGKVDMKSTSPIVNPTTKIAIAGAFKLAPFHR